MEKVDDHQEKRKVNEKKINKIFWILLSLILLFLLIGISRSCGKKQAVKTEDKLAIKAPQNPYLSKIDSLQAVLVDLQEQLDECNEAADLQKQLDECKQSKIKRAPVKVIKKRKRAPVVAEPVFVPKPNLEIDLPLRGFLKNEEILLKKEKISKKPFVPKKNEPQTIEPENDKCDDCLPYGTTRITY